MQFDYLTKRLEVFPTADQSAATVADLLVREVVSRYGVPGELLSDRGKVSTWTYVQVLGHSQSQHYC